jgi:hypothetical protein
MTDDHWLMYIYMLIQSLYYRISTSCQVLHLSVVCVISAIFLNHQKFGWCSLQCSLISNTYDGKFWYSVIGIVVCFLEDFTKLWWSRHFVQSPSSQSGHQTSDGLEIWRISHIPQKDGELDMMLISCNIVIVLTCKCTYTV